MIKGHIMKNYVIAATILTGLSVPATVSAAGRVAVLATIPQHDADVVAKLMATGRFADVDYINVRFSTPTLDTLSHYHSVLLYSGQYFSDRVALGDNAG